MVYRTSSTDALNVYMWQYFRVIILVVVRMIPTSLTIYPWIISDLSYRKLSFHPSRHLTWICLRLCLHGLRIILLKLHAVPISGFGNLFVWWVFRATFLSFPGVMLLFVLYKSNLLWHCTSTWRRHSICLVWKFVPFSSEYTMSGDLQLDKSPWLSSPLERLFSVQFPVIHMKAPGATASPSCTGMMTSARHFLHLTSHTSMNSSLARSHITSWDPKRGQGMACTSGPRCAALFLPKSFSWPTESTHQVAWPLPILYKTILVA